MILNIIMYIKSYDTDRLLVLRYCYIWLCGIDTSRVIELSKYLVVKGIEINNNNKVGNFK